MTPSTHRLLRQLITAARVASGLLALLLLARVGPRVGYSNVVRAQAADNPIVVENQQPGSNGWVLTMQGNDATGQIKGYASATSVNQNDSITFYVSVNPAQSYTIDFYRFGWYGGMGGRLRSSVGPLDGTQQAPCASDPTTGLLECQWSPSYVLTVPGDWTSGVYAAKLTNSQGYQNYVVFVVKDGRPAPFLYQQPIATDQAYNNYPNDNATGKSLYGWNSYGANTVSGNTAAVKVSFDRPMANAGLGNFITWDFNFVRWLEQSGYDVTYTTDIDTHVNGGELLNHRAFLSVGHDEYWTKEMRDAAEAARDAGVNLAFFGADDSFTQIRLESSSTGIPNRVVVEYRNEPWAPTDPIQGPTTTGNFRDAPINRPEQTMMGIQFVATMGNTDYIVTNSSHWAYAGTGFSDGDVVHGIVGYEADGFMANYPSPNSTNLTLLSQSPYVDAVGNTGSANSAIYQAPSGAWVFDAGTMSWPWALDDVPGLNHNLVDSRIQRTTANILNAFLNGAPPTIASFTPISGSAGTAVTITGTGFTNATAVNFNGTAATFSVSGDTTIQTSVPAGATTGPLTVTTPGGTATSASTFTTAATISTFAPASGPVGTNVTIGGSGFTGTTAVSFNGVAATFSVASDTTIQTAVPAGASTGPLTVTTPAGSATSTTAFAVSPAIASFTPNSGTAGTTVTIAGSNFSGATSVAFNGTAASFTVTSDTSIQAIVPAAATAGPLSVTTPSGTATSAAIFTPAPTIASFSPGSGAVGTSVTITGANFIGTTAVTFNGATATFTVASATTIKTTVPAAATTGRVVVTTPAGSATSANNFGVTPTISGLTPTSGRVGTSVTITGTTLTGATAVRFNGTSASFSVISASQIQATVPAGATSGAVTVTTPGGTASSPTAFVVMVPLTVSKSSLLGNGYVSSNPGGIECGGTCSSDFGVNTTVTLTAIPTGLSVFLGWSGCDSVAGQVCTVSLRSAKSVTASFLP